MPDGPPDPAGDQRYAALVARLNAHPLPGAIRDRSALRQFMEHHVYAVWDFMSLLKALQALAAPSSTPWVPPPCARLAGFVNQLVFEEESDREFGYLSHFEIYCQAMTEVGADPAPVRRFAGRVRDEGLEAALAEPLVPAPAREFMRFTFDIIRRRAPHQLAAVLAYGRELVVPGVFRALLGAPQSGPALPPTLRRYLERHVQLDGDEHGPLSVLLVEELCDGNGTKHAEAMEAATGAIAARLALWDGIHTALTVRA